MERAQEILDFWFGPESSPEFGQLQRKWFMHDDAFDQKIRERFFGDFEAAAAGRLDHWAESPKAALALVVLLDQFARNLFRGHAEAFATDERALRVASAAINAGYDAVLPACQRRFLYMPFMHSESLRDQQRSVKLMQSCGDDADTRNAVDYAQKHLAIIERFGRFPHRNHALGRTCTAEELEFLQQPGSSF
jgi:uncharacterized protein (DUF924 family)